MISGSYYPEGELLNQEKLTVLSSGIALNQEGRNRESGPCSAIINSVTLSNPCGLSGLCVKNERVTLNDLQSLSSFLSLSLSDGTTPNYSSNWLTDLCGQCQVSNTWLTSVKGLSRSLVFCFVGEWVLVVYPVEFTEELGKFTTAKGRLGSWEPGRQQELTITKDPL